MRINGPSYARLRREAPRRCCAVAVAATFLLTACSAGEDSDASLTRESDPAADSSQQVDFEPTPAESNLVEPDAAESTSVAQPLLPVTEPLASGSVLDSTAWFTAIGYAEGSGVDGLLLDVSADGSAWLMGGGEQPTFVLSLETQEISRLVDVSSAAKLSGNGEYLLYTSLKECTMPDASCEAQDDEQHMLRLATGEIKSLGAIRSPTLINAAGDQVVGLVANPEGRPVEDSIKWADGSETEIRLLFSALGELPTSWLAAPQLHAIDGGGEAVLYSTWLDFSVAQEALYSVLADGERIDLVSNEFEWTRVRAGSDISDAGDFMMFATTYGLTVIAIPDGQQQNYVLERPDRTVRSLAIAGERLLAVTVPRGGGEGGGAVELVSFELGAGAFDQTPDLLLRIPDASSTQTPGLGGFKLLGSADGTALGVSIFLDDASEGDAGSWLNIIVDLGERPTGSYIEVMKDGSTEEVALGAPITPDSETSLARYLADLYDIGGDLITHQAALLAANAGASELGELWREASVQYGALDPPEEAAELHERSQTLANGLADVFEGQGPTVQDVAQQGAEDPFAIAGGLVLEGFSIEQLQIELAVKALEAKDDPLAEYVTQILELQREAGPLAQRMVSALSASVAGLDGSVDQISDILAAVEQIASGWEELDPPNDAGDLHELRLELFRDSLSALADIDGPVGADTQWGPQILARNLADIILDSNQLNAAWSRFIADALRNTR